MPDTFPWDNTIGESLIPVRLESQSARTLSLEDHGRVLRFTYSGTVTVTVPNLDEGFSTVLLVGPGCTIELAGAGDVSFLVPTSAEDTPPTTAEDNAMISVTTVYYDPGVSVLVAVAGNLLAA